MTVTVVGCKCPNDDSANDSCFPNQADIFAAVVQACVNDPPLALDFNYKPAAEAVLTILESS